MNENIIAENNNINNKEDIGTLLLKTVFLAKNSVPYSHKRIASNYVVIKKVYKFHAINFFMNSTEYDLLKKYDMEPLESTTASKAVEELEYLKKWSMSNNFDLINDSDNLLKIRAKELKNISASAYVNISDEMYNGYKIIEKYFEEVTDFYKY